MRRVLNFLILLPALVAGSLFAQADLVIRNAKIVTLDAARPRAEALAAKDGRIVAVGANAEVAGLAGPSTRVLDLGGALAIPGFIEGHGHFIGIGNARRTLNLMEARRWDDIVAMVAAAAKEAKPGQWILGRGWHQSKWDAPPSPQVNGFPTHLSLSAAAPKNPVLLTHASGHASMVNAEAMRQAGITRSTPSPSGGEILHDASGEPTGLLNETAQGLIHAPPLDLRESIELATRECLSKGITSFQDAGSSFATIDVLKEMAERGTLGLRLWVMVRAPLDEMAANLAKYKMIGAGNGFLTVRAIKRAIDGALGSRGAWLLAPYSDLPSSAGLNTEDPGVLAKVAELAVANGYQLCVHAIGDRGNRETLDIYERTFRAHPGVKDLRWRIEHAQHLSAADIPRFGKLGVIASMQGIHCTSDAPYVLARLGPGRAEEGAYVWRKLMDSGAVVTNGTDAPVEDVNPIASYYATVTRRSKDGSAFYPAQRLTRLEALESYTAKNAYAAFEENQKGVLKKGMLADVTVLSKDILTISGKQILKSDLLFTIVDGKVAYQRGGSVVR